VTIQYDKKWSEWGQKLLQNWMKSIHAVWLIWLLEFSKSHCLAGWQSTMLEDFWPTVLSVEPMVQYVVCLSVVRRPSVCNVLYCGKTVRPSEKVSEGVNRKPGSKSSFFGSPPYFYFRFRLYSHRDGRFWLIFGRILEHNLGNSRKVEWQHCLHVTGRPATVRKSKLYVKSRNVSVET